MHCDIMHFMLKLAIFNTIFTPAVTVLQRILLDNYAATCLLANRNPRALIARATSQSYHMIVFYPMAIALLFYQD